MIQPKIHWTKRGITTPKKKSQSEHVHQRVVAAWFRMQYPRLKRLMTLGSFGENIGARRMAQLKLLGLEPGHADLVFRVARGGYHGLDIEMKRSDGKLAPHQKEIHQLLRLQGFKVVTCYGSDEAISVLKEYMSSDIVPT